MKYEASTFCHHFILPLVTIVITPCLNSKSFFRYPQEKRSLPISIPLFVFRICIPLFVFALFLYSYFHSSVRISIPLFVFPFLYSYFHSYFHSTMLRCVALDMKLSFISRINLRIYVFGMLAVRPF
jgi:hypothetical protein